MTLPLITADSQESEWFCEHRDSECLEMVNRPRRDKGWSDGAKQSPSSLTVWFSEFQAARLEVLLRKEERGRARARNNQETVDRNRSKD